MHARALRRITIMSQTISRAPSPRPRTVVAVIGTTGVGKSDLAVALARSRSRAQSSPSTVLSADSMQLYKGLDVITNKMTAEEMWDVRHWGLDLVTPGEGSWEVGRWCAEADKQIAEMPGDAVPIICGGTHYFIQHFLFPPDSLSFERSEPTSSARKRWKPPHPRPTSTPRDLDSELSRLLDTFWTDAPAWPSSSSRDAEGQAGPSRSRPTIEQDDQLLALHRLLSAVDPDEAGRWHWRDGRKVRRGLERWWEKNGPADQGSGTADAALAPGRRARFRTIIFWVYEPLDTLRPRLSRRVDKMVENGLLREIAELRGIAKRLYGTAEATDHSEGIFQSIGYKEFADLNLDQPDPSSDPAFAAMLERMKMSTQQYAKSQIKWIRKQLLPAVKEARNLGGDVEVYVVRGGQEGQEPAIRLLGSFLQNGQMPSWKAIGHPEARGLLAELEQAGESRVPDTEARQQINQRRDCEVCSTPDKPISVMLKDWDVHAQSKTHRMKTKVADAGGVENLIAQRKAQGLAKKLEREALKAELDAQPPLPPPDDQA